MSEDLATLLLIAMPVLIVAFLGWAASRGETPNVYRCRRCGVDFRRQGWKRFPDACPSCGARDWADARR